MAKHSVVLQVDRCRGCTTCIQNCPTDAIRVRNRKATLLADRCIDCGKCIQVCPQKAIRSVNDPFDLLEKFEYNVALPEPALFGQFHHLDDTDIVLGGLLKIGFHHIFEVATAAELLSDKARREAIHRNEASIRITSACPTVLRIIQLRFPQLLPYIKTTVLPMELAAQLAREEAVKRTGLPPEKIGVFAIVPCSAKVTTAHEPMTLPEPVIDGAFAINDIYLKLLEPMKEVSKNPPAIARAGATGLAWGWCGGEALACQEKNYVAVDGIENVIDILEAIEDNRLPDVEFVELSACTQGCVGGCLNVENPYGAKMRLIKLARTLPQHCSSLPFVPSALRLSKSQQDLDYNPAFRLDPNRFTAMEKLLEIDKLTKQLPGLNCASCGAPSCRALAEDVVMGRASLDDCIFKVRERVDSATPDSDNYLPTPFRHSNHLAVQAAKEGVST